MTEDSTEHTPGPWVVSRIDKTLISGCRGFSFSNIAKTIVIHHHGSKKHAIAEANARLIAAAPERAEIADEMLDALKEIIVAYQTGEVGPFRRGHGKIGIKAPVSAITIRG